MKVITLVPVKNEAWILRFSLSNFSLFSDQIIILDDNSTDDSRSICAKFPTVQIIPFDRAGDIVDMSARRNALLEAGRRMGGTHFFFLDADEVLSEGAVSQLPTILAAMNSGESIGFSWITVLNDSDTLVFDPRDKYLYKDILFCDDGISNFRTKLLSEDRTPSTAKKKYQFTDGYILHFQHLAKKRYDLKQVWYRMNEFIAGERSALRINTTYNFTKKEFVHITEPIKDLFTDRYRKLMDTQDPGLVYEDRVFSLFEKFGVAYFEKLDIWYISELREKFIKDMKRNPKPDVLPDWAIHINDKKNQLKNWLYG